MSTKKPKLEVLPPAEEAQSIAKATVDQAEAAFETAAAQAHEGVQMLDAAAAAYKAFAADLQMKSLEIVQDNVAAVFDFWRHAFEAREPAQYMQLAQEFTRGRFEAFQAQGAELGEIASAFSRAAARPMQENFGKPVFAYWRSAA